MVKTTSHAAGRIRQGDILRDVQYLSEASLAGGISQTDGAAFPLVIVLTQDCDLSQDFMCRHDKKRSQDKALISALVAPLYNAEHFYAGMHLSGRGIRSEPINKSKTQGTFLRNNQNPRFHYLEFPDDIELVAHVIDFKHYFSVSLARLEPARPSGYVCTLSQLYREDVSQRFASFLSRIALPDGEEAPEPGLGSHLMEPPASDPLGGVNSSD